jgi:two-component system chemotaxis response regulator CheY
MDDGGHLHELLEALEGGVLALERGRAGDPATAVHRMFQSAHNLKSGLAMAGLARASTLVHDVEDGLDDIRRGRRPWSSPWADVLLDAVDRVKVCVDDGNDADLDLSFAAPEAPVAAAGPGPRGVRTYRIEKLFVPGLTREEFEGHLIYEDIAGVGTLQSVTPGWDGYSKADDELVVRFVFTSDRSPEQLAEIFFDPLIEATAEDPPPAEARPVFRLLIIEDHPLAASVVSQAVAGWAEVHVTGDGREGVEAYARAFDAGRPYDVVVCDLEMPEVDGHTALQRIRDEEAGRGIAGLDCCLVFMNTSSQDLDNVRQSFKLQADGYFIKPLSAGKIQKKLEQCVSWLQTRRRNQGWKNDDGRV